MRNGEPTPPSPGHAVNTRSPVSAHAATAEPGCTFVETTVSPFHCLYQDALEFHTQSHLKRDRSEAEASRFAREALMLYLASAEALVHQAATELGQPDLARVLCDPQRPLPLADAWRLLPAVVPGGQAAFDDPNAPPWPQFAELLAMRTVWAYPGEESQRRAYYRQRRDAPSDFEPLEPHQAPPALGLSPDQLVYPRTGLPRDPYALRPRHLDTIRGILDAAIDALNKRLDGALTRNGRHRREPVRVLSTDSSEDGSEVRSLKKSPS